MSAYASMNLPELLNHRDQISAEIFRQTGDASVVPMAAGGSSGKVLKLTKNGKVRKPSANKGKPTALGDFNKKITAEYPDHFAAYKEANPDQKGPHLKWYKVYRDENKDEYEAFKAAWALEHPKDASDAESTEPAEAGESATSATGEAGEAAAKPKKVLSPEHLAKMKAGREAKLAEKKAAKEQMEAAAKANSPISLAPLVDMTVPVAVATPVPVAVATAVAVPQMKGPKKVTKKTQPTPEPAPAPVPEQTSVDTDPEELPFKHNGTTYIRIGIQKADGNHIWSSTDLWHSKKGKRAGYAGELMEDGEINEDAEEPSLV